MSGRIKRQLSKSSLANDGGGGGNSGAPMHRKKRRVEVNSSEDDERAIWTPKHLGDIRAYNRCASEAPAELFRKDLISAMKLADNEPLTSEDFWGIADPWKQEWERGVQVPVNPDLLPEPSVSSAIQRSHTRDNNFRLPKDKYIRVNHDEYFSNDMHILSNLPTKAEKMCRYDMDDMDDQWLTAYNGERARMGAAPVPELCFELIIEHLEETCWDNIHKMLKVEESQSLMNDEDVICDVCRSPDSEEGNEMVFCDTCNICVHQACYGITAIPSGSWLCRTCSLGIKPDCVLCPNKGGAMKSTKSGQKWAHVACALWIPEVSIGSVERMEPITKIPNIPQSRWALVCVLCRERRGACIQCSVKTCKTAYHVTCAFRHGLEMKAIIEDENADDGVKLRSYCVKHSVGHKKNTTEESDVDPNSPRRKKEAATSERTSGQARAAKLRVIEAEFDQHVDVLETSNALDIDRETTETIFYYWKLKRRAGFNKPLLTPRCEEFGFFAQHQEQEIERIKMFVQLRQYLERVRNLCYMVSRREKLSRSFLKSREQTFQKQVSVLSEPSIMTPQEIDAVLAANHGPGVYDRLYSHDDAAMPNRVQYEAMIAVLAGSLPSSLGRKTKPTLQHRQDLNGLRRDTLVVGEAAGFGNPYRRKYINGAVRRQSRSSSLVSSASDSDSSLASNKWTLSNTRLNSVFTSSEEERVFGGVKSETGVRGSSAEDEYGSPSAWPSKGMGSRGRVKKGKKMHKTSPIKSRWKELSSPPAPVDFDSLLHSSPPKLEVAEGAHPRSQSPMAALSSSEEEAKLVPSPRKSRAGKGRGKRKVVPAKLLNTSHSSEDDAPHLATTPAAQTPKRGRGRPPKVSPQKLPDSSIIAKNHHSSDDDSLPPPTYRLTSDSESGSDKDDLGRVAGSATDTSCHSVDSSGSSAVRRNLYGGKSAGALRGSDAEGVGTDILKNAVRSDASLWHSQLKTKAAMKDFTVNDSIKLETARGIEDIKDELKSPVKELRWSPLKEHKTGGTDPSDVSLFVPQRQAAKKASELITGHNLVPQVCVEKTSVSPIGGKRQPDNRTIVDAKSPVVDKRKKGVKALAVDENWEEPVKKMLFEPPEILPYVPMRQAAKKAVEKFKGKSAPHHTRGYLSDDNDGNAATSTRQKKGDVAKGSGRQSRSPRKSKTLNCMVEEVTDISRIGKVLVGPKSIFSESDDESSLQNDIAANIAALELPGKHSNNKKSPIIRKNLFSDSSEGEEIKVKSLNSKSRQDSKHSRQNVTRGQCISLGESSAGDLDEDENREPPTTETRKKAPDKKLKTSKGRLEHGFRPPAPAGGEPRASQPPTTPSGCGGGGDMPLTPSPPGRSRRSSGSSESCIPQSNQSWSERGWRDAPGQFTLQHFPSDPHGPPPPPRGAGELVPSSGSPDHQAMRSCQSSEQGGRQVQPATPTTATASRKATDEETLHLSSPERTSACQKEEAVRRLSGTAQTVKHGVYGYTDEDLTVERLDDIVEMSDNEIESKKRLICVSDDEGSMAITATAVPKRRVDQPHDSGYKSDEISVDLARPKSWTDETSYGPNGDPEKLADSMQEGGDGHPFSGKSRLNLQPRRRNLEEVIGDMRRNIESKPSSLIHEDGQHDSTTLNHDLPAGSSIDETEPSEEETGGSASFVAQWRDQWATKSPPPLSKDHMGEMGGQATSSHMASHMPPHMDLNSLSLLELQRSFQHQSFSNPYLLPPEAAMAQYSQIQQMIKAGYFNTPMAAAYLHHNTEFQYALSKMQEPPMSMTNDERLTMFGQNPPTSAGHAMTHEHVSKDKEHEIHSNRVATEKPLTINTVNISDRQSQHHTPIGICDSLPSLLSPNTSIYASAPRDRSGSKGDLAEPDHNAVPYKISSREELSRRTGSTFPAELTITKSASHPMQYQLTTQADAETNSSHATNAEVSFVHGTPTSVLKPLPDHKNSILSTNKDVPDNTVAATLPDTGRVPRSRGRAKVNIEDMLMSQKFVATETTRATKSRKVTQLDSDQQVEPNPVEDCFKKKIEAPPLVSSKKSYLAVASVSKLIAEPDDYEIDVRHSNRNSPKRRKSPNKKPRQRTNSKNKVGRFGRCNSIKMPKELVGTVYDLDFEDEFDDGKDTNNVLDGLRLMREKRHSSDIPPSVMVIPVKDETAKRSGKKSPRKVKGAGKDKVKVSRVDEDDVAKILKDFRTQAQMTKGDQEPDDLHVIETGYQTSRSSYITKNDHERNTKSQELFASVGLVSISQKSRDIPDDLDDGSLDISTPKTYTKLEDHTNQLRLKIKGPYANANVGAGAVSAAGGSHSVATSVPSATSSLRRMRKKELIRQYCYQDMNQLEGELPNNLPTTNPLPQPRASITIPKAVASMTSIPTRDDYKMYTQQDDYGVTSGNPSSRRKRQSKDMKVSSLCLENASRGGPESCDVSQKKMRGIKKVTEKEIICKVPPKLRISLGKPDQESSSSIALDAKRWPPKKRLTEEDPFTKIKNDNLKFREQIMADFDREHKSTHKPVEVENKRASRKRRILSDEDVKGGSVAEKDESSQSLHKVQMVSSTPANSSTTAPKLVIKFSKSKSSEVSSCNDKTASCSSINNDVHETASVTNCLQMKLNVTSTSSPSRETDIQEARLSPPPKVLPLKLKFSRRQDGYVASSQHALARASSLEQGPGPPSTLDSVAPSEVSCRQAESLYQQVSTGMRLERRSPLTLGEELDENLMKKLEEELAMTDGPVTLPETVLT